MSDLKIRVGVELENPTEIKKQIDKILNNDNKVKLDIDDSGSLRKFADKLKGFEKIKITAFKDGTTDIAAEVTKNLIETEKVMMRINGEGVNIKSLTSTNDYAKASKKIYSDLLKLQNEEFAIRKKMENADGESLKILLKKLNIVEKLQDTSKSLAEKYNLKDKNKDLELQINREKQLLDLKLKQQNIDNSIANKKQAAEDKAALKKQNDLYNQISKSYKEEFSILKQLISAEGTYKAGLEQSLSIVKQRQQALKSNLEKSNLQDQAKENNLVQERITLERTLQNLKNKVQTKNDIELREMNELINKSKEQIKLRKQLFQDKYGSSIDASAFDEATNALKKMNRVNLQNVKQEIKDIGKSLDIVENEARQTEKAINNSFTNAGNGIRNSLQFLVTAGVLMDMDDLFREGINNVKNMDSALVDLTKVVEVSKSELEDMRLSALSLGKDLGQSSIDIMNGMAEFGRVTKDLAEIKELTRVAIMGANVTDLNTEQMASSLNTVLLSMGLNAKNAAHVLDTFNELQNNFRISGEDLASGIGVVGNAAHQAGMKLEEIEGYLTAMVATTGMTGSEAGTALKSFISRMYRIGKEGAESAGQVEQALKDVGIAVREENDRGSFRDFGDIIEDVAAKFGSLTEAEQMMVAQAIGGTHHYSKFIGLIKELGLAGEATEKAVNSAGSAVAENEKYLNSIEGKMNILKVSFESLSQTLLSGDTFKGFIDGANGAVMFIDKTIQKFGAMRTIVPTVAIGMSLFSKSFRDKVFDTFPGTLGRMTSSLQKYTNALEDEITANKMSIQAKRENGEALGMLGIKTNLLRVKTLALKGATLVLQSAFAGLASLGITIAAQALIKFIDNLHTSKKELAEMNASIMESINESNDKSKEHQDNIKSAKETYAEIQELENKISNTQNQEKRIQLEDSLIEKKRNMISLFPELADGFASEEEAMNSLGTSIDNYIKKQEELINIEKRKAAKKALEFFQQEGNKDIMPSLDQAVNSENAIADIQNLLNQLNEIPEEKIIEFSMRGDNGQIIKHQMAAKDLVSDLQKNLADEMTASEESLKKIADFKLAYESLVQDNQPIPSAWKKMYEAIQQYEQKTYEASKANKRLSDSFNIDNIRYSQEQLNDFSKTARQAFDDIADLNPVVRSSMQDLAENMRLGYMSVEDFAMVSEGAIGLTSYNFGNLSDVATRGIAVMVDNVRTFKSSADEFMIGSEMMKIVGSDSFNMLSESSRNSIAELMNNLASGKISTLEFAEGFISSITGASIRLSGFSAAGVQDLASLISQFIQGRIKADELRNAINSLKSKKINIDVVYAKKGDMTVYNTVGAGGNQIAKPLSLNPTPNTPPVIEGESSGEDQYQPVAASSNLGNPLARNGSEGKADNSSISNNTFSRAATFKSSSSYSRATDSNLSDEEREAQREREQMERDANSAIEKMRDKLVKALKKKIEEQRKAEISVYDARIEAIKKELELLEKEDEVDKKDKLKALKEELELWKKNDSAFAKEKIKELEKKIKETEKEVKKEELEQQIKDIEKEKDAVEEKYKEMLEDKNIYLEANKLITSKSQQEIIDLIYEYAPDYTEIGLLFGKSLVDGIKEGVSEGLKGYDYLSGSSSSFSPSDKGGPTSSSSGVSSGKGKVTNVQSVLNVREGAGTNYKATGKLYANEEVTILEEKNGWYKVEYWSSSHKKNRQGWVSGAYIQRFNTGGIVGDWFGKNGALAIVDKKERVLTENQTRAFDELVYNWIPKLASLDKKVNSYIQDKASNIMNFNNVYNVKAMNDFEAKNFQNDLTKQVQRNLMRKGVRLAPR